MAGMSKSQKDETRPEQAANAPATQPAAQTGNRPASQAAAGGQKSGAAAGGEIEFPPRTQNGASSGQQDAIAMLTADHRKVDGLFADFEKARTRARKTKLATDACLELKIHSTLEEQIFYPATRESADDDSKLDEAQVEHDTLKLLIMDIEKNNADSPFYAAKVKVLSEYVKHHVEEEEGPGGIFAQAREAKLDLAGLGQQMRDLKQQLQKNPNRLRPKPVSLNASNSTTGKEQEMPRNSENGMRSGSRGRDEQGRFSSGSAFDDDDYDRSRSRRGSSGRDDDDDDRGGRSGGSRSGQSRGRDDDDNRSRGGWFGDPEGHSEAARRGRDDDDNRGRGRGGGFGDSEGRSEAARRGRDRDNDDDDDDDRGGRSGQSRGSQSRGRDDDGRGWFGDSQGHSEAASRGWDDRGSSRSSRDDDDDRGGRPGQSRGGDGRGWFGDSQGHSEAARRGRDDDGRFSRSGSSRSSRDDDGGDGRGWSGDSRGHAEAARRGWENRR